MKYQNGYSSGDAEMELPKVPPGPAPGAPTLPEVQDIRRINVQPGDVFVVRFAQHITAETASAVAERLSQRLGVSTSDICVLSGCDGFDVLSLHEHA